jgi:uncharacterized protein (DUF2164 family)
MAVKDNNIGILTDTQKREAIKEIIAFFQDERGEEIGVIAAESFLDLFLEKVGNEIYNKGVEDTKGFVRNAMAEVDANIDITLKRIK